LYKQHVIERVGEAQGFDLHNLTYNYIQLMYSLNWDYANKLAHGCILVSSVDRDPFHTTLQEFKAISVHFVFSLEENTLREITRLL